MDRLLDLLCDDYEVRVVAPIIRACSCRLRRPKHGFTKWLPPPPPHDFLLLYCTSDGGAGHV